MSISLGFSCVAFVLAATADAESVSTSEATGSQTFQEDDALALDAVDEFVGFETTVRTVVKRPRPATASTLTLEADDLATASMLTADDAIRLIPGVVLVQHGAEGKGYQFFVRGFDALHGADIETRIAGVPFNEWSNVHASGYLDLSIIPPEIVSSVEVTKGPFGIDQGLFATAASIHYGLGIAERNRGGRAWYTAGSSNRHRLLLSYAPTSLDDRSFVTAEVLSDDGFGEGRATRRAGATARTTLYSDRQSNLTLFVAGSTSRFQLPGIVRLDDVEAGRLDIRDSYESDRWRGESDRALASLEYSRRNEAVNSVARLYGMARRLTLVENFTGFLGDPVNGDAFQQSHDGFLVGFDAEQLREFNDRWALTFSVGGRGERVQQTEDALDANGEVMTNTRAVEGIQTAWNVGSSLRMTPLASVRVDAGARLDGATIPSVENALTGENGGGTRVVLSPRVAIRHRLSETFELFAAYGRGLRPPELGAFVSVGPDETGSSNEAAQARPTVNDALELGTRIEPFPGARVTMSGFATFIERESVFDHVSGTSVELDRTRRVGAEVAVGYEVSSALELRTDATWVDARFDGSGSRVPLAPRFVAGAHAVVRPTQSWFGGVHATAIAPRDLPFGGRSDWATITSAVLGRDWGRVRAELAVDNLLNQDGHEGVYQFASVWPPTGNAVPSQHVAPGPPLSGRFTLSLAL